MYDTPLNERQPRVNWLLIAALFGLMIISVAFISSAKPPVEDIAWHRQFYAKQIIWFVLGTGAAVAAGLGDYRTLTRWSFLA